MSADSCCSIPTGNMSPHGRLIVWVWLSVLLSASALELLEHDRDAVVCSQGFSECTMKDMNALQPDDDGDAVEVLNLTANVKLCSKSSEWCTLCLVIDTELRINLDHDKEDEKRDENQPRVSLTLCYQTIQTVPACKKVEFTVNHTALTQANRGKVSVVITESRRVYFDSRVFVKLGLLRQEVVSPSLQKVCSQGLKRCVQECRVPEVNISINEEVNDVELLFGGSDYSLPSMCIQYERNGTCQSWNKRKIPLYSVTHCMCLQAWYDQNDIGLRSESCPFKNMALSHRNVWDNVSVAVRQAQSGSRGSMLLWSVQAPCRLEGEAWPCRKEHRCREMRGFRQQLAAGRWTQNSKGLWERNGSFVDIDLQLSPCVMVKLKGMEYELGPFCFKDTGRWRWSLLVVCVVLLVFLAVLMFNLHHHFVKKWVWSWHHGGLVKIGRKGHVVLLSPPDLDAGVSDSVCQLGSLLCSKGFSVSVDQWSRKELWKWGPLPWLHSKLLDMDEQGDRVVLVLTRKAVEKAEEWMRQNKEITQTKERGLPQMCSPYSDVFTAALCVVHADKLQGRAGKRFLLVTFESQLSSDRKLPEPLQGLPLFQLPLHTPALLTELTVQQAGGPEGKTWTTWWNYGWKAKNKEKAQQQRTSLCKYTGADKNLESEPLKDP